MKDVTATTGSLEQIYDALHLMSTFAEENKPIHIHCYSGVGRSAMMTATHLAHRYLLGDPVITACIDKIAPQLELKLDPEKENFIPQLYKLACGYVSSKRSYCQFDNKSRKDIAIEVLSNMHETIQKDQSEILSSHDNNYAFIAALVQSATFKKLHYEYYRLPRSVPEIMKSPILTQNDNIDLKKIIRDFFDGFLLNQEDWYQHLTNAVTNEQLESRSNPLEQFCTIKERRDLLAGVFDTLNQLALEYPDAYYSQHIAEVQALKDLSPQLIIK